MKSIRIAGKEFCSHETKEDYFAMRHIMDAFAPDVVAEFQTFARKTETQNFIKFLQNNDIEPYLPKEKGTMLIYAHVYLFLEFLRYKTMSSRLTICLEDVRQDISDVLLQRSKLHWQLKQVIFNFQKDKLNKFSVLEYVFAEKLLDMLTLGYPNFGTTLSDFIEAKMIILYQNGYESESQEKILSDFKYEVVKILRIIERKNG